MDAILQRWFDVKMGLRALNKEEEIIKKKIRAVMTRKGITDLHRRQYHVSLRQMKRETLTKKDCPRAVWEAHRKVSVFPVLRLNHIGEEVDDDFKDDNP